MPTPDSKQNCPHCGKYVEPNETDTQAGTLLICPECFKLIGHK